MKRVSLGVSIVFGLSTAGVFLGCGVDSDRSDAGVAAQSEAAPAAGADIVASFSGWTLTREEWRREFVRTQGDSAYVRAEASEWIAFAELLLDKELLLSIAREGCPKPDRKRARLDRVVYEKNALRHLAQTQSERVPGNPAYFESLSTAAGLVWHRAAFPRVRGAFATFWDSVRTARSEGAFFDVQTIEAPRWIFGETEQAEPVFELRGVSWTVDDFVRSLDAIDVDHWPTRGDSVRINTQIEQRVHRLIFLREAEQSGILDDARFREKMRRTRERHLLDQFRDRVVRTRANLGESDLRDYFDRNRDFYRSEANAPAAGEGSSPEISDSALFRAVRVRVERNALDEWLDREIDRLLSAQRLALGARVHISALRDE